MSQAMTNVRVWVIVWPLILTLSLALWIWARTASPDLTPAVTTPTTGRTLPLNYDETGGLLWNTYRSVVNEEERR